jgi:hypothetical protein
MFWPRTFYRSGWLRCVGFISIWFWAGGWLFMFWAGGILYILYYYIIYYTIHYYYIISYTILSFYSLSSFPSSPLFRSYLLFYSSSLSSILFLLHSPVIPFPIFILYLSVLTYTYLYYSNIPIFLLFIQISDPARSIGVDGWGVMCLSVCVLGLELVCWSVSGWLDVLSWWMVEVWCVWEL